MIDSDVTRLEWYAKYRRKKGERLPQGYTRNKIVSFILASGGSTREVDIIQYLFDELGISDQRSIRTHLENLRSGGIISKTSEKGRSNHWSLNPHHLKESINHEIHSLELEINEKRGMLGLIESLTPVIGIS